MSKSLTTSHRWSIARLAYWHLDRGHLDRAESLARGLIALNNRDGLGWLYYGEARLQQGDLDGAIRGFEQAARWMSEEGQVWMRLGKIYLRVSRFEEARRALEKARQIGNDPALMRRVKALLRKAGRQ